MTPPKLQIICWLHQTKETSHLHFTVKPQTYLTRGPMFSDGRDWRREGPADTGRICNKFIMSRGHYVWASAEKLCLLFYFHVPTFLPSQYCNTPEMKPLYYIIHLINGNTNTTYISHFSRKRNIFIKQGPLNKKPTYKHTKHCKPELWYFLTSIWNVTSKWEGFENLHTKTQTYNVYVYRAI